MSIRFGPKKYPQKLQPYLSPRFIVEHRGCTRAKKGPAVADVWGTTVRTRERCQPIIRTETSSKRSRLVVQVLLHTRS